MTDTAAQPGLRTFLRVLRNRDFFWLWVSQLITMIGDYFMFLAVPFLITVLAEGGSVTAPVASTEAGELPAAAKSLIALATLAFTAPRLLGVFTGVFIDRWDRRRTIVVANLLAAAVSLLPVLVGSLDMVWIVVVSQFALALITRFIYPAHMAVVPLLVEEDDLLAANGLSSISQTIGIIVGPLLAGVTVATFGVRVGFVVDGACLLVAALIVRFLVRIPALKDAPSGAGARAVLANIGEGLRFLVTTRLLLMTTFSFALVQGALAGVNMVWVPYLRETFGVGPVGITLVDTAQGIGMALGAVALGLLMSRLSKLALATLSMIGVGALIGGFGVARAYWLLVVVSFLLGTLLVPWQSAINTLLQMSVPKALQGRVFGSYSAITSAAGLLISAIVTALIAVVPLRGLYVGGGAVMVFAGGLWFWLVRDDVRRLEAHKAGAVEQSASAATLPVASVSR